MASAQVVCTNVQDPDQARGRLFEGQSFWLSSGVPQRAFIIQLIEVNGGEVAPIEKNATIRVADHKKPRRAGAGTHSYEFITRSVRRGILEDLESHLIHPKLSDGRAGPAVRAAKGTRVPFTAEDDYLLEQWVTDHKRRGGRILGNEIYIQLAEVNPRHTFQSWRDRWIKYVSATPRASRPSEAAPITPPSDASRPRGSEESDQGPDVTLASAEEQSFTKEQFQLLMNQGDEIIDLREDLEDVAWQNWADKQDDGHSGAAWRKFWLTTVLPVFRQFSDEARPNRSTRPHAPTLHSQHRGPGGDPTQPQGSRPSSLRGNHISLATPDRGASAVPAATSHQKRNIADTADGDSTSSVRKRIRQIASTQDHRERLLVRKDCLLRSDVVSSSIRRRETTADVGIEQEEAAEDEEDDEASEGTPPPPTLPEPERSTYNTQAILNGETQVLDFALPVPAGGWTDDDESPANDIHEHDADDDNEDAEEDDPQDDLPSLCLTPSKWHGLLPQQTQDTQGLLSAEAQLPDLDIPEPPGGWQAALSSSKAPSALSHSDPSALTDTPNTSRAEPDDASFIGTWIDALVAAGASEDDVILSLKVTSMYVPLAQLVLLSLSNAGGLPEGIPGVWTAEEDEIMRGGDGREIERLREKHGEEKWTERLTFLERYGVGDDEE